MNIVLNNKALKVEYGISYNSKDFSESFGDLQKILNNGMFEGEQFNEIVFFINNLIYADPLPLLYILTAAMRATESLKVGVKFVLFQESFGTLEHQRFLNFLLEDGFLSIINDIGDSITKEQCNLIKQKFESKEIREKFIIDDNLCNHTCIIKASILKKYDEDLIFDILRTIKERLTLIKLKQNNLNSLISRLNIFISETLQNVFEHAYKEYPKYSGLYIRYRANHEYNIENSKSRLHYGKKINIKQIRKEEENNNPAFDNSILSLSNGVIEVFVIDDGNGLLSKFEGKDPGDERPIINDIFHKGFRSNKKNDKEVITQYGGLNLINNLFAKYNDQIIIKADYNWTRLVGFNEPSHYYISKEGKYDPTKVIKGFSIIGRLNCGYKSQEIISEFFGFRRNIPSHQIVSYINNLSELKKNNLRLQTQSIPFLDKRFIENLYDCVRGGKSKDVILLPCPQSNKHSILNDIKEITKRITDEVFSENSLIIGDIEDVDIGIYRHIINSININYIDKVNVIILITRELEVAVYSKYSGRMCYNKELTEKYVKNDIKDNLCVSNSILDYYYWLRIHDSYLIWKCIANSQSEEKKLIRPNVIFANNIVEWGPIKVDGYLDFPNTIALPLCGKLYKLALKRISGNLIDNEHIYFIGADQFTEILCSSLNMELQSGEGSNILVGSILVTGLSTSVMNNNSDGTIIFFFNHESAENPGLSLFEWSDRLEWKNKFFPRTKYNYKRIGETGYIAEGGENYFLKHYNQYYKEICETPLKKMYQRLQENNGFDIPVLRFGHDAITVYHDFISANSINDFQQSILKYGDREEYCSDSLLDFLMCEFYKSLGWDCSKGFDKCIEENITLPAWQKKIKDYFRLKQYSTEESYRSIIIYPYEFNNEYVVKKIKSGFSEDLQRRIFPILSIVNQREGVPLIVSPLVTEGLRIAVEQLKKINKNEELTVTVFDDRAITGRRRKELKHLMIRLGATQVQTISILDRRRFSMGYNQNTLHKTFWKLELPPINERQTCSLCVAVSTINKFKDEIISNTLNSRIKEATKIWAPVNRDEYILTSGIGHRYINLPQNIVESINSIEYGDINSDIGLCLYLIEYRTSTGTSGILHSILTNADIDNKTKILVIACQILLFSKQELSEKLYCELMSQLYQLIESSKEIDKYTALGLMLFFCLDEISLNNLYKYIVEHQETKELHDYNLDIQILHMWIYYSIKDTTDEKNRAFKGVKYGLIQHSQNSSISIYSLFLYTNAEIEQSHFLSLSRAADNCINFDKQFYIELIISVEHIRYYMQVLTNQYKQNLLFQVESKRLEIQGSLEKIKELCSLAIKDEIKGQEIYEIHQQEIVNIAKSTIELFSEYNKGFYLTFHDTDEILELFKGLFKRVFHIQNIEAKPLVSNDDLAWVIGDFIVEIYNNANCWVYLYQDIVTEIESIIYDIYNHSEGEKINYQGKEYIGIITIRFKQEINCIELETRNCCKRDINIEEIRNKRSLKGLRPTLEELKTLVKRISTQDIEVSKISFSKNTKIFTASLLIPCMHIVEKKE